MGSDWLRYQGRSIPAALEVGPEVARDFPKAGLILDLGCGFGRMGRKLHDQGFSRVVGLDLNPSGLAAAREDDPRPAGWFAAGLAESLPFGPAAFDGALMVALMTTLPWAETRARVAAEAARVVRPGGLLHVADYGQNWDSPLYRARYEAGLALGLERGAFEARQAETGELEFLARHFTGPELTELFEGVGFTILNLETLTVTTRTSKKSQGHRLTARRV